MNETGSDDETERGQMLHLADVKLQVGENTSVSRHTRYKAIFDSVYIRLVAEARGAGCPEPTRHPSERIVSAGAAAAALDQESLDEVLALFRVAEDHRYNPGTHPGNVLHALALARHIAEWVKR